MIGVKRNAAWLLLGSLALAAACGRKLETYDDYPARQGAYQPAGNGQVTDEASACSALVAAIDAQRAALSCGADTGRTACPDLVRPAGGADCFDYDQGALDACVAYYAGLSACAQFDTSPCIVTAIARASCGSGTGGSSGTGGASGTGGTSGTGGAAGSGTGGTAGSSSTGGAAGSGSGGAAGSGAGGTAGSAGSGTGGTAGSAGATDAGTD